MRIISLAITFIIICSGCAKKKVEITSNYIVNEYWNKTNEKAFANSITIQKMKIKKDSMLNISSGISPSDVVSKLEEDSSFMHYANVQIGNAESYHDKKIYFDRYNGFAWGSKSRNNSKDTSQTIGRLQIGNWYRFSDLGSLANLSEIYVYVDSSNKVHRFDIPAANY